MSIDPSEFGGEAGLIPPDPHELTAAETARLQRATDPDDPADNETAALVREQDGEGRL